MHSSAGTDVILIPNYAAVGVTYTQSGTNGVVLGGQATVGNSTEAEICWGCHSSWSITEWGVNNNATTGTITYDYGSLNQDNWVGALWTSANFAYKTSTIRSTHTANPQSLGGPSVAGVDTVGQIRCSYCHDVHNTAGTKGVTGDVNGEPYLRGSWRGNPYNEDGAPQSGATFNNSENWGNVPRAYDDATQPQSAGGYWIDQNSGSPTSSWVYNDFGGLCQLCHGTNINNLNQFGSGTGGSMTDWLSTYNGHANAVKGGAGPGSGGESTARNIFGSRGGSTTSGNFNPYQHFDGMTDPGDNSDGFRSTRGEGYAPLITNIVTGTTCDDGQSDRPGGWCVDNWGIDERGTTTQPNYHQFSCSKCHNPHASRLPRLMITNCLDTKHNAWDNTTNYQASSQGTNNTGRTLSNWSSAQNCHRLRGDDPSDGGDTPAPDLSGNRGWNTITPW